LHVFEMPLLGYGGYVPFALELFVLRNLLWRGAPRVTSRGDVGGFFRAKTKHKPLTLAL
jgi:hypothetical protein